MAEREVEMIKRWREITKMHCSKTHGFGHKIAHFLGIANPAYCLMSLGEMEGEWWKNTPNE